MKTALAGILVIAFILMGLDLLKSILESKLNNYFIGRFFEEAEYWHERRKTSSGLYRDYAHARYRNAIAKAASIGDRTNDRW